tara:strand:- start:2573 stop:2986 length:414 start_codon:yes stop_codon:yes gene_type:complete
VDQVLDSLLPVPGRGQEQELRLGLVMLAPRMVPSTLAMDSRLEVVTVWLNWKVVLPLFVMRLTKPVARLPKKSADDKNFKGNQSSLFSFTNFSGEILIKSKICRQLDALRHKGEIDAIRADEANKTIAELEKRLAVS